MSDPSIQEVDEIIGDINQEIFDTLGDDDFQLIEISLYSNGNVLGVQINDQMIWHTDDDFRSDVEAGNGDLEPFKPFIRKEIQQKIDVMKKINLTHNYIV